MPVAPLFEHWPAKPAGNKGGSPKPDPPSVAFFLFDGHQRGRVVLSANEFLSPPCFLWTGRSGNPFAIMMWSFKRYVGSLLESRRADSLCRPPSQGTFGRGTRLP
jgi:hypothetical protein